MKHLLLSLLLCFSLTASEQILLVVADDLDQTTATLQRFELTAGHYERRGAPIEVNLGRNGLAWGLPKEQILHRDGPEKREGDGRAPAGIFGLGETFGYAQEIESSMPYRQMRPDLICVDDGRSEDYNLIIAIERDVEIRSFEWMRRDDPLYEVGITVRHNPQQVPGMGSCIFLHVEKAPGSPTAGCTSMPIEELRTIISWLRPQMKPLLVQIPKSSCSEIALLYKGVTCFE